MAWVPFASRSVPGKSPGSFKGGPWKLVLHTTEGSSAAGAFAAYRSKRIFPHFTVERERIWQHIDTSVSASAVLNRRGGVETNRSHAIQIEMVGYAGQLKDEATLASTARLGRWLEAWHGIPRRWPAGRPQGNAGSHNRSRELWTTEGGWYGHSQVPENTHWDPGRLTEKELVILMGEAETGRPEAWTLVINDGAQPQISCVILDGEAHMSVREYCAYADYAPPVPNAVEKTVSFYTAKVPDEEAPGA